MLPNGWMEGWRQGEAEAEVEMEGIDRGTGSMKKKAAWQEVGDGGQKEENGKYRSKKLNSSRGEEKIIFKTCSAFCFYRHIFTPGNKKIKKSIN